MYKCIKINFVGTFPDSFVREELKRIARDHHLEGIAQYLQDTKNVSVIIGGSKENIDAFLDVFHNSLSTFDIEDLIIEPYVHGKDYRGVFRFIE